jgi:outer membrane protein assembly factor BamB
MHGRPRFAGRRSRIALGVIAAAAMLLAGCTASTGGNGQHESSQPGPTSSGPTSPPAPTSSAPTSSAAPGPSTSGGSSGPVTLKQQWKHTVGGAPGSNQQIVNGAADANGVYVNDVSGQVSALGLDGTLRWQVRVGSQTGTPVAAADNRVLYYDASDQLTAIDAGTGIQAWTMPASVLPSSGHWVPALAGGLMLVYNYDPRSGASAEVAVRTSDGGTAFTLPESPLNFESQANPAGDGTAFYAIGRNSSNQHELARIDTAGTIAWQSAPLPEKEGGSEEMYAVGGDILVMDSIDETMDVLAFDSATGAQKWSKTGLAQGPLDYPVALGSTIAVSTTSGLIGLDAASGKQMFATKVDNSGPLSMIACGANLCATGIEDAFQIDAKGKTLSKTALPTDASELIAGPDGAIYAASSSTVFRIH